MTTKVYHPTVDLPPMTLPPKVWQVNGNGHNEVEEPVSEAGRYVSEEEYWARYYVHPDFSYEWNDGVLEVKPVPDLEKITMFGWFMMTLRAYLDTTRIAKLLFQEMGFRLPMPHKTTVRKPDLFVVRNDNPVTLGNKDPSYQGIADLCVESLSDSTQSEIDRDTLEKKSEYEFVGVQEYYILDPGENMAFYTRTPNGIYVPIPLGPEQVVRSQVLPGFQFRISDLYYTPSLITMATNPLYQDFVLPEYQAALRQIEQAKAQVKQAKVQVKQAKTQAKQAKVQAEEAKAQVKQAQIQAEEAKVQAEEAKVQAEEAKVQAEEAKVQAEEAKVQAEEAKIQVQQSETRAQQAETLAERRAAKLRALGIVDDDLL